MSPDGEPAVSLLVGELLEVINKYHGHVTLAEAIGALEIVKIGLYHSADAEKDSTT